MGAPRGAGFDYTASTEKMDNTLEQQQEEEEEAARKAVAEVDTKNPTEEEEEAEVDTDFSPEEVEEHNQDADNLKSNSAAYMKIHHNPNFANTDFPSIETAVAAEDSDSAAAAAEEEQNSTVTAEGMAYTKPWTLLTAKQTN